MLKFSMKMYGIHHLILIRLDIYYTPSKPKFKKVV